MNEGLFLLVILIFLIAVLSKIIVKMMNSGNGKYKVAIFYSRMLLGFFLTMVVYIGYLLIKGEDILIKFFG